MKKLSGLIAAPHTPFDAANKVNFGAIDQIAEVLIAQGVKGAYVCGTTGEGIHCSVEERKAIAERCDLLLVIGSQTSSNSKRLVEVGDKAGADDAMLISSAESIDWDRVERAQVIGLSAGASAPEYLTDGVIAALKSKYDIEIQEVETVIYFHRFIPIIEIGLV